MNTAPLRSAFEIEVGFWYGTGFVSYALAVVVCAASFIAWKVLIGMSLHDNRLFWWMASTPSSWSYCSPF